MAFGSEQLFNAGGIDLDSRDTLGFVKSSFGIPSVETLYCVFKAVSPRSCWSRVNYVNNI